MAETNAIPALNLKPLRIIIMALAAGATLFSLVVLNVGSSVTSESSLGGGGMRILRVIHLVMTIVFILAAKSIGARILSGRIKLQTNFSPAPTIEFPRSAEETFHPLFYQRYTSSAIIQLALIETTVLFGGIVLLLASQSGALSGDPTYYLHLLPLFYFLTLAGKLMPSERKINDLKSQLSHNSTTSQMS